MILLFHFNVSGTADVVVVLRVCVCETGECVCVCVFSVPLSCSSIFKHRLYSLTPLPTQTYTDISLASVSVCSVMQQWPSLANTSMCHVTVCPPATV